MPLPALAVPAAKLGASIVLPYLLKKLGTSVIPAATKSVLKNRAMSVATRRLLGGALKKAGGAASAIGSAGTFISPFVLGFLGRGLQGAATAGGAAIGAVGNMPAIMNQLPQGKKELYGNTPMSGLADALSGVGSAAGLGVSAIGNAAGSSINDLAQTTKMMELQSMLHDRTMNQALDFKRLNLQPSVANLTSQMLRSQGRYN